MHIVEPTLHPLSPTASYTPTTSHTLPQAQFFLSALNIKKMIIVQPSIYGNDNSCTLSALRTLGPKQGRAVIQFDPSTTSREQLEEWHALGIRGVRLNFKSVGAKPTRKELEATMQEYADAVRELGWCLELYISLEDLGMLDPEFVDGLGVRIIIVSNCLSYPA